MDLLEVSRSRTHSWTAARLRGAAECRHKAKLNSVCLSFFLSLSLNHGEERMTGDFAHEKYSKKETRQAGILGTAIPEKVEQTPERGEQSSVEKNKGRKGHFLDVPAES